MGNEVAGVAGVASVAGRDVQAANQMRSRRNSIPKIDTIAITIAIKSVNQVNQSTTTV
jgi:hypothetical protein